MDIKVIGIDPKPSGKKNDKEGHCIYNGKQFEILSHSELAKYLQKQFEEKENILICWDAPLSFPKFKSLNFLDIESLFTQRTIEKFFSRAEGEKTPTGISVQGYAGCPHWTISQYLLGYPRINPRDKSETPFELIFDKKDLEKYDKSLVEVHPAIAIWLWLKNKDINEWEYKKKDFNKVVELLKRKDIISKGLDTENDDQLDAYVAWKLGTEWVEGNRVDILGNNDTGSFLLPYDEKLFKKFDNFTKENKS